MASGPSGPSGSGPNKKLLAIIAAVIVILVGGGIAAAVSLGGDDDSSSDASSPEAVAEGYLEAFMSGDCEAVKTYAADTDFPCEEAQGEEENRPNFDSYDVGDAEIEGDEATVPITIKFGDETESETVFLEKQEGDWKVVRIGSPESEHEHGTEPETESESESDDTTPDSTPDSTPEESPSDPDPNQTYEKIPKRTGTEPATAHASSIDELIEGVREGTDPKQFFRLGKEVSGDEIVSEIAEIEAMGLIIGPAEELLPAGHETYVPIHVPVYDENQRHVSRMYFRLERKSASDEWRVSRYLWLRPN